MKARTVITLLSLTISFAASYAQTEEAKDSCAVTEKNTALYRKAMEAGKAGEAYLPWKAALAQAPHSSADIYTDGVQILRSLLSASNDSIRKKVWLDELMSLYDQQIAFSDSLIARTDPKPSKGCILGTKVHDYLIFFGPNTDVSHAYQMEQDAIQQEKEQSTYFMFKDFMELSFHKLRADSTHEEQFIKDYLSVSDYMDAADGRAADSRQQSLLKDTRNMISGYIIESKLFTGKKIQAIYGPKVEECRTDSTALAEIIGTLERLKYTYEDAYLEAQKAMFDISPSAHTAMQCAQLYKARGNADKYIGYTENAVALSADPGEKSDGYYEVAKWLLKEKKPQQAKRYALKALAYAPDRGKLYILMAQIYASHPNWSDNALLNKCTFIAIIDKLRQAKSVEPEMSAEVDKMISVYTSYAPKADELASIGLRAGSSMNIGGWINETITITD